MRRLSRRERALVACVVLVGVVAVVNSAPIRGLLDAPKRVRGELQEVRSAVERERDLLANRDRYAAAANRRLNTQGQGSESSEFALLARLEDLAQPLHVQLMAPAPQTEVGPLAVTLEFTGMPEDVIGFLDRIQVELQGVVRSFSLRTRSGGEVQARAEVDLDVGGEPREP